MMTDLTVIIVNYNTKKLLFDCLSSVMRRWQHRVSVLVVDNSSTDGSTEMIRGSFPKVKLIKNKENLGFAKGNNQGLKSVQSRYYLLLNSDTIVLNATLDNLIEFMDNNNFAIGSCKILNEDKTLQPNGGDLPFGLPLFFWLSGLDDILEIFKSHLPSFHYQFSSYYQNEREIGWVSGSAMIIKNDTIRKIGLLDESIFMYGEDVEYCLRARKAGFRVGWTDKGEIIHLGGGSSSDPAFRQWLGELKGLLYIYKKYLGILGEVVLKITIYIFVVIRVLAFLIIGKPKISQTYVKILFYL